MPCYLADCYKVHPGSYKLRETGVPKRVGGDFYACLLTEGSYHVIDCRRAQPIILLTEEEMRIRENSLLPGEILLKNICNISVDRNGSMFVALTAAHDNFSPANGEENIGDIQTVDFRYSYPTMEHQHCYRTVP